MKNRNALLFAFFAGVGVTCSMASESVTVEERGSGTYVITLSAGAYELKDTVTSEGIFTQIVVENGNYFSGAGNPALPIKSISLGGEFSYEVVSAEYDTIKNVMMIPAKQGTDIIPDLYEKEYDMTLGSVYEQNSFWPDHGVVSSGVSQFQGISATALRLTPFRYNPVTKTLLVAKEMILQLQSRSSDARSTFATSNSAKHPVLANVLANSTAPRSNGVVARVEEDGKAGKVLFLTNDKLLPAAEKLARWQRMKGYDVLLKSVAGCHSKEQVISMVDSELMSGDAVSNYLFIFGNTKMIQEYEVKYYQAGGNPYQGVSVTRYCDKEREQKGEYLPDVAHGIIPANNLEEAEIVVGKILDYEMTPIMEQSFYDSIVAASQAGFTSQETDVIMDYMENKGYATHPRHYKNEDSLTIKPRLNGGQFMAAQYDHGIRAGWVTPKFWTTEAVQMSNGKETPFVYSINCLSGSYDYANGGNNWTYTPVYEPDFYGFCDRLLFQKDGGAVGAVGATQVTTTGYNDYILYGLFKAIWPEDNSKTPIHRAGDVFVHAMYHMVENMGPDGDDNNLNPWEKLGNIGHTVYYHNFSDPTLNMRTKAPVPAKATYGDLSSDDKNFDLSGVNLAEATAVLYNESTKGVIGRARISGGSGTIPLTMGEFKAGDKVTLTINGVDCVPLIDELHVDNIVGVVETKALTQSKIEVFKRGFVICNSDATPATYSVLDLSGRVVSSGSVKAESVLNVGATELSLSQGVYILNVKSVEGVRTRKFTISQ